jgi:hypothetical protein
MWKRTSERAGARANGEQETWTLDLLRWLQWEVRSHFRRRVRMKQRFARHPALTIVHLTSQPQVDAWIARQLPDRHGEFAAEHGRRIVPSFAAVMMQRL